MLLLSYNVLCSVTQNIISQIYTFSISEIKGTANIFLAVPLISSQLFIRLFFLFSNSKYISPCSFKILSIVFSLNCNSKSNSVTENHVAKEPDYLYSERNLIQFLFKLNDSIEVNIRPVIVNDEDPEYTTTGIYFGSEAILRIRGMLEQWQK